MLAGGEPLVSIGASVVVAGTATRPVPATGWVADRVHDRLQRGSAVLSQLLPILRADQREKLARLIEARASAGKRTTN